MTLKRVIVDVQPGPKRTVSTKALWPPTSFKWESCHHLSRKGFGKRERALTNFGRSGLASYGSSGAVVNDVVIKGVHGGKVLDLFRHLFEYILCEKKLVKEVESDGCFGSSRVDLV